MSDKVYLFSILAAVVWLLCYLLIDYSHAIHFLLLLAFGGILLSLKIAGREERNSTKQ